MELIIGSDHAGFDLKEVCKAHLGRKAGFRIEDAGVYSRESADYPRIAHAVASRVADGTYPFGLLICGTGLGMSITANRHHGVRATLCHNLYTARMAREHNDANILVLGARVIGEGLALEMLNLFLETPFQGGRHAERINLIEDRCCSRSEGAL